MEIKCLDHGFIRLVEKMGDDGSVVQAARVSYGKGTKTIHQDRELIRYLLRHDHTSPFEMIELKFHVKMPIFVARQWIRHRTANVNEISGRYSIMEDEFYTPATDDIKYQSKKNHQGRAEDEDFPEQLASEFQDAVDSTCRNAYSKYTEMTEKKVARELTRLILPLNLYTQMYWKIDLHNLFRFLRLRLDEHAQKEIRVYSEAIADILRKEYPVCWEAFEHYQLHARKFSQGELEVIRQFINKNEFPQEISGMGKLEYQEFKNKLNID